MTRFTTASSSTATFCLSSAFVALHVIGSAQSMNMNTCWCLYAHLISVMLNWFLYG